MKATMKAAAKPTKMQLEILREAALRRNSFVRSGGGHIVADPKIIQNLVAKGLATQRSVLFSDGYLTRAGYEVVGVTPPEIDCFGSPLR